MQSVRKSKELKRTNPIYKRDLKCLRFLSQIAEDVDPVGRAKIAAMIVPRRTIPAAVGTNKYKTHPLQAKFGRNKFSIYIHAEIEAISRALKNVDPEDLKRSTLYICRMKDDEEWGLAKPCAGCWEAIKAYKIGRIVWSLDGKDEFEVCLL